MIDRPHAQAAAEMPDAAKRGPVAVAKDAEMPTGTEWMVIGTRTANAQAAAEMPDAAMSAAVAKDADEEERRLQPAVAMDRAKDTVCLTNSTEIGT